MSRHTPPEALPLTLFSRNHHTRPPTRQPQRARKRLKQVRGREDHDRAPADAALGPSTELRLPREAFIALAKP